MADRIEASPVSPRPEGGFGFQRRGGDADAGDDLRALGLSTRATLADASQEWNLFTMGVVFSSLPLPVDPVQEFINSSDVPIRVAHIHFDNPLFQGLVVPHLGEHAQVWNHTLFACKLDGWPLLRRHLSSIGVVDRDNSRFYRTFIHSLDMVDVVAMRRFEQLPAVLPMVRIDVVGFSDSVYEYGLFPPDDACGLPRLGTGQANVRDRLMGASVLADAPLQTTDPAEVPAPPKWNSDTGKFDVG